MLGLSEAPSGFQTQVSAQESLLKALPEVFQLLQLVKVLPC